MNISEIARLAGVSPSAVSRYLNNGYISEEKKEAIRKVIEETGYTPSQSAQAMRTKRHNLIGVIVPRLSSESVSRMVDGITEGLGDTKYNILLANTYNSVDKELDFLNIFSNNIVDGVILIGTVFTRKHHAVLKDYPKPLVVLGQCEKKYSSVYYDDFGAAYTVTSHLADIGCRNIACIHCTTKDKAAGKARLDGFHKALDDLGLSRDDDLTAESNFNMEGGYGAMKRIFESGKYFDGVFCATDTVALGARNFLDEQGLGIGTDVKLAGVGDSKMSKYLTPPMTTIRLHYKTGGLEACKMMIDKLNGKTSADEKIKLGYEFIIRQSTVNESSAEEV